jgi:parvulin-like peptidyl-prolyl isomerase
MATYDRDEEMGSLIVAGVISAVGALAGLGARIYSMVEQRRIAERVAAQQRRQAQIASQIAQAQAATQQASEMTAAEKKNLVLLAGTAGAVGLALVLGGAFKRRR